MDDASRVRSDFRLSAPKAVFIGKHAVMQNARNQDTSSYLPVEQDVAAFFESSQAWANLVAGPAEERPFRQSSGAMFNLAQIALSLFRIPGFNRISANLDKVRFGSAG
jgi:hypothetical protein